MKLPEFTGQKKKIYRLIEPNLLTRHPESAVDSLLLPHGTARSEVEPRGQPEAREARGLPRKRDGNTEANTTTEQEGRHRVAE